MTDAVEFGSAAAEYARSTPSALETPILPVGRSDTNGLDYKLGALKPEPFWVYCVIFAASLQNLHSAVDAWYTEQRTGTAQTLALPEGSIPNCLLQRVRRASEVAYPAASTNGAVCMQDLALQFVQVSE